MRSAQFGYINSQVTTALAENQPVISVDTKKKAVHREGGRVMVDADTDPPRIGREG
jgi:hypothetical protein